MIEHYDTFNTKGCPDEIIFGSFNDQPIPYIYYNFLNDDNGNVNDIPGTRVDDSLLDNEGVEYAVVLNDE